jgi:membrane-associated protein
MGFMENLINIALHVDQYLNYLILTFGVWTYVILFGIIFAETGLVVTPFFPGDSLLFIASAFASAGSLNVVWLFTAFTLGAIIGDTINYWIGHLLGRKVFHEKSKFFKREYLIEAEEFYNKYGSKTIVIARFVPIIRTFAPFVAGIGRMSYSRFIAYNIVGGIAWVIIFLSAGYFFGNIAIVKNNLSLVIIGIIVVSLIPAGLRFLGHVLKNRKRSKS